MDWSFYPIDKAEWSGKEKLDRLKWNRGKRLRLLRSFPIEYLSLKIKKLLDEEERALPGTEDWDSHFSGVYTAGSRMSSDQMSKASDEQLTNFFNELDDSTQWDHPRRKFGSIGGTIQASRELEVMAEKEPHRVLKFIRSFKPGRQEIAAGHAVIGLAKSDIDTDVLKNVTDLDAARKWLVGVRESEWLLSRQAFGEVLLLWRCFYRDDDWARKLIEDIIGDINDTEDSVRVCRGLAFSASNIWHKVIEFQDICTDVLTRLSSSKDSMTHDAIAKVFRYGEPLPLNANMKRIVEAILPNDALLIKSAENLIEGIEPLATAESDLVYRISIRLLDVSNKNQKDILRISYIRAAESLVNIAITLQRTESHRVKGLELFEKLLESEVNEARQALYILDRRPIVNHTPKLRAYRRQRYRKRT